MTLQSLDKLLLFNFTESPTKTMHNCTILVLSYFAAYIFDLNSQDICEFSLI